MAPTSTEAQWRIGTNAVKVRHRTGGHYASYILGFLCRFRLCAGFAVCSHTAIDCHTLKKPCAIQKRAYTSLPHFLQSVQKAKSRRRARHQTAKKASRLNSNGRGVHHGH